jgi:ribosomal protein S6--L-glutamate ligase
MTRVGTSQGARRSSSVCFVVDRDHPVITATAERVSREHPVAIIDPQACPRDADPIADVYLLKSHSAKAIELARKLEARGARVVNTSVATETCVDRVLTSSRMQIAGLPWPRTASFACLHSLVSQPSRDRPLRLPLVVKSRRSRRGDLVAKVSRTAELDELDALWADEPVIVQEFLAGDGWDWKLWVIGNHLAGARRRTALEESRGEDHPVQLDDLPAGWLKLARDVGALFGLELYGVDVLATARGPVVVDVNAFPGYRSVRDAPAHLASFVDGAMGGRGGGRRTS